MLGAYLKVSWDIATAYNWLETSNLLQGAYMSTANISSHCKSNPPSSQVSVDAQSTPHRAKGCMSANGKRMGTTFL